MRTRPTYSDDLRREAIALYLDGYGYQKISDELGIARQTVGKWLKAAGIKPRPAGRPKGSERDDLALTGGQWVNVRGIQRWEAAA